MSETENNGAINGPAKVPQPHGGALNAGGTPGNKGGGRPPDEFKDRMAALATRDDVEAYLERCLKGEFGPKFYLTALAHVTDRGYGKAVQPLTHGNPDGTPMFKAYEGFDPTDV